MKNHNHPFYKYLANQADGYPQSISLSFLVQVGKPPKQVITPCMAKCLASQSTTRFSH